MLEAARDDFVAGLPVQAAQDHVQSLGRIACQHQFFRVGVHQPADGLQRLAANLPSALNDPHAGGGFIASMSILFFRASTT